MVNHIEANRGKFNEGKHLKFPIMSHPRGPYNHHIIIRADTGADVNCMNEKTFNELFPEVQLSSCPHEIQNFGNSIADISILGQFRTYLEFRGEKYLNTFIVTDGNDCPTTAPSKTAPMTATTKQVNPVHAHTFPMQNTSWSGPPAPSAHVHKPPQQVLKPGDSVALRKVQHSHKDRTSVNRLPLTKQEILSHYSSCFEGIGTISRGTVQISLET